MWNLLAKARPTGVSLNSRHLSVLTQKVHSDAVCGSILSSIPAI